MLLALNIILTCILNAQIPEFTRIDTGTLVQEIAIDQKINEKE